jgi:histidine triad (HIT) family protein
MAECVFCAIVAGRAPASVLHEDDLVLSFLDINPFTQGHLLVIPKAHHAELSTVDGEAAARMFAVATRLVAVVRTVLGCPGVNLFLADGEAAWQTVFHVHTHVIPRWGRVDGMRLQAKPTTPPREHLDELAARLAAAF